MTHLGSRRFLLHTLPAGKSLRTLRRAGAIALGAGLAGLLILGLMTRPKVDLPTRLMADAVHRALEVNPDLAGAFEPLANDAPRLLPARAGLEPSPLRDLAVGDRLTLLTPDGRLHVLQVCDAGAKVEGCLNILAIQRKPAPVGERQRSL
jgi:hypothetical protein